MRWPGQDAASLLLMAAGLWVLPGQLRAQSLWKLELAADSGSDCSASESLSRRVRERSGSPATPDSTPVRRVAVNITKLDAEPRFRVQLSTFDASERELGLREVELDAERCSELDQTLVLMIAAAVGVHDAYAAPPKEEQDPEVPPNNEIEVDEPASAPWDWSLDVGAGARAVTSLTPNPAAGMSVELVGRYGPLAAVGAFVWVPHATHTISEVKSHFSFTMGQLDLCVIGVRTNSLALALCAAAQAGEARAYAEGLWSQRPDRRWLLQLGPGVRLQFPMFGWSSLNAAVGLSVPVRAPRYSFRTEHGESTTLHQVDMGIWVQLGWSVRFGT